MMDSPGDAAGPNYGGSVSLPQMEPRIDTSGRTRANQQVSICVKALYV